MSSPQSDRRKSRIACRSLTESALKRVITAFASEGPLQAGPKPEEAAEASHSLAAEKCA